MKKVVIYTKDYCPYCKAACELFKNKGVDFIETDVTYNEEVFKEVKKKTGWTTVPQIFIEDEFIGGWDDINALNKSHQLDPKIGL
ncbi:putative glutaredoxin [Gottschalkia purinilytica]|uniref:Putative glutaredoxin n=1 Tax=Gottschalkia purinilytica TaxID=1503 RepID=A0A0L0W8T4_GOTPU|nr:glutaredoxin [Gottschalkia purinilytica]KNF07710.1 putative glutaredoxin [Gottschalkia purinilytica]